MHAYPQVLRLALRDFAHESRISLCYVLALVAVMAPLLVLFGLKFGLVDTLAQRLVQSPHNREIVSVGSRIFEPAWFQDLAAREDVAFIVPNTRRIAASLSYLHNPEQDGILRALHMIPTATADPLLPDMDAPLGVDQIILSADAARKLGAAPGTRLEARLRRRRDNRDESESWGLTVTAVAPDTAIQGEAAFVPLELLEATEDYRDGVAVPLLGWDGDPPARARPRTYAKFRLYARSIDDVSALKAHLNEQGIDVKTRAAEIESMRTLEQTLDRVFWLIATIGAFGFLASLAANLLANVERKRRDLSLIRLLGFPTASIVGFPVVQALSIGLLGALGAILLYQPFAALLNDWFSGSLREGEYICRLLPWHLLTAFAMTILCACLAAAWAGLRAARIQPAEGLREI